MSYIGRTPSHVARMTDLQLLAHLLTLSGVAETEARAAAHALLDDHGDLTAVLSLPPNKLIHHPRLNQHAGGFLALSGAIAARYADRFRPSELVVKDRDAVAKLLAPVFQDREEERVCAICLDEGFHLLGSGAIVTHGDADSVSLPIGRILALAISSNAYGIILAHNHPTGPARLSASDLAAIEVLRGRLAVLQVSLLDHYLWTPEGVTSLHGQLAQAVPPPPLDGWDAERRPLLSRLPPRE